MFLNFLELVIVPKIVWKDRLLFGGIAILLSYLSLWCFGFILNGLSAVSFATLQHDLSPSSFDDLLYVPLCIISILLYEMLRGRMPNKTPVIGVYLVTIIPILIIRFLEKTNIMSDLGYLGLYLGGMGMIVVVFTYLAALRTHFLYRKLD